MIATAGGPQNLNCVNTHGLSPITESIPGPRAEPFKRWLAKVCYERIQDSRRQHSGYRGGREGGGAAMRREPLVLECGGKRSATPLWEGAERRGKFHALAPPKAPSALHSAGALHIFLAACRKSLIHECVTGQRRVWVSAENGIARHRGPYYPSPMQTISLKLPEALLRQLESEARVRRVTKSHLVRASLEKALAGGTEAAGASCYDLARDLAGKVKGLPKDLATNPAYLKGFGR